jgi:hypothetical protein
MRFGEEFSPAERDALMQQAKELGMDVPKLPPGHRVATNFLRAVVKHVGNGMKKVEFEQYQERLDVCNECKLRVKNRCTHEACGCFLDKKAWWDSEECPLGLW